MRNLVMVVEHCHQVRRRKSDGLRRSARMRPLAICMWLMLPSEARASAALLTPLFITCHRPQMDVVHRDLKPENFLFKEPNRRTLKAIDFGLSSFYQVRTPRAHAHAGVQHAGGADGSCARSTVYKTWVTTHET